MVGLVYAFNVVCFIPDIPIEREKFAPSIVQHLLKPIVLPNAEALKQIMSQETAPLYGCGPDVS